MDGMEQKREAEAENSSSKKCRENGHLLPANLDPRIDKETHSEHNERYEACTQHTHQQLYTGCSNVRLLKLKYRINLIKTKMSYKNV